MSLVTLDNVSVAYGDAPVLQGISLDVCAGDYIGLIGPNGAGKSTLLKTILGIVRPDSGTITLEDGVRFGYVPQNYLPESSFSVSVREVLEMGLGRKSIFYRHSERERFEQKLEMVGLDETFLERSFHALSGGQKQRVIIARSLLQDPNVLLFDEPLSGVDYQTKIQIYNLLARINKEYKTTIIFVSHEIESVIEKCHRVLCLNKTLHQGCHPVDFMQGDAHSCPILESKHTVRAVHHHHKT